MSDSEYAAERAANRATLTHLKISTRVPSKWRMVDLETGQIWKWEDGKFKAADDITVAKPGDTEERGETGAPGGEVVVSETITLSKEQLGDVKEVLEGVVKNLISPIKLVEELKKRGVIAKIGVAYLGDDTPDGYVEVKCSGCGAKAKLPKDDVDESKALLCPGCSAQQSAKEDKGKYKDFDPAAFD